MVTMGRRKSRAAETYCWRMLLTGSLGIGIALFSYVYGTALERDLETREFQRLAQVQYQNTQELLRRSTQVLLAFRGFFAASQQVERDEYARFAGEILAHYPEIYAIHWAPKVAPAQRAALEAEIRTLQAAPVGIFDADARGKHLSPAPARALYFPVQYAEPYAANRKVVGLDTLGRSTNQTAIRAAAASGEQQLTPVFPLIQDPDGPLATALYQPVFATGLPTASAEQRQQALQGFLILLLRPSLLVQGLPFGERKVAVRLYDRQDAQLVAIHPRGASLLAPAENVVHHELQVPGRTWVMEFVASAGFGESLHIQPVLLMLSLLLLTGASLVFLDRSHRSALALQEANRQLLRRQLELDDLAHYDPLTGLPNRLLLYDRIGMALGAQRRQGGSLAVCVLDLDGFKAVNDRFGHPAGDIVLCEVARRLQALVRASDTAARLGGDEFVVVLPGMAADTTMQQFVQRLIARLGEPISLADDGPQVQVSTSIGIAFADGQQGVDTLIHQADIAMYQAKHAGKGCYRIFGATAVSVEQASV
ncbi:diguanylate cyclase (GGDEF) domain-containing protein [Pseudomonas linyingensis]|uniref:Diguanylate cyclase (GGDEF) domain-containing protein n=2 Tax=Pseudomonas linyingensis TaxID=915471 RepID=A0A1H6X534_9PSED|nr:diguanylate cyclase (GGDEF) domain-containing protein [Pseudomonas linyingensis]